MMVRTCTLISSLLIAASTAAPVAAQQQPAPTPPTASAPVASAPPADAANTDRLAPSAAPADAPPPTSDEPASATKDWVIELNPRLWWVSPSGEVTFPGGGEELEIEELNLDTPAFTPAGSFSINADKFRVSFFGASYSQDAEFGVGASPLAVGPITLAPGSSAESSFDLGIYEINVGYRFLRHDFKKSTKDQEVSADLQLDLYGVAGVRAYDLGIGVSQASTGEVNVDQFYVEPLIGIRSEFIIIRDFSMNLQLDAGAFGDSDRSSFSFNIAVDFEWRPIHWLGIQLGWRQLLYSFNDGDDANEFKYQGGMAGLFTGVVIRF